MRTARTIAFGSAGFFAVVGAVYWALSGELAGTLLLFGLAAASGLLGWYLRRRDVAAAAGPADRADAEPADAADEDLGAFDTASVWPPVVAAGAALVGTGAIFGSGVLLVGAVVTTAGLAGLVAQGRR